MMARSAPGSSMRPPPERIDGPVDLLRVRVLQREELHEAARHYARKNFRGEQGDSPFLQALMEIALAVGDDPSPYYLSAGRLAIQRRDLAVARALLESALNLSEDRATIHDALVEISGVGEVFSPREITDLRSVSVAPA